MKTKTRGKNKTTRLAELFKASTNMTLKDIKRNVVVRGMPFEKVVDSSIPSLQNWLHKYHHNEIQPHLLDEFDDWIEGILKERNSEDLIYPELRLGYIKEKDEEGNTKKIKKVKGIKKKKKKKEKTPDGIYKGTKKALTFESQQEGLSLQETIDKVMEEFPDASEKSIKIWWKKSRRTHGDKEE